MMMTKGNDGLTQVLRSNRGVVDNAVVILSASLSVIILILYLLIRFWSDRTIEEAYEIYMLVDEFLLLATIVVHWIWGDGRWTKYVLAAVLMYTALVISAVMSLPYLIFALPILIVTSYYDRRFTLIIAVIGAVMMCTEPFISSYMGIIDLNYCDLKVSRDGIISIMSTPMEEARRKFIAVTLPSLVIYIAMTVLSLWVTTRGLSLMREHVAVAEAKSSMENELAIASDIQAGLLPTVFPDTESYSISAVMKPAKNVGGDFYDFMKVNVTHVAFLVADVSGKGIPAALFMASAMTLLRSNLKSGLPVDAVMDRTNYELIRANKEKLFVTAWLGILDLTTGSLSYVNAGHNPPFIIHADGKVEQIRSKPNFILGRKKGIRYKEHRLELAPGDRIFLYTDGLTDSINTKGEMFTEGRVLEELSSERLKDNVINGMMGSVKAFSKGTEQFDDITMLLAEYRSPMKIQDSEGEEFDASPEGHDKAMEYISARLKECGCSDKIINDIRISASEIISNIDMYAYEGRDDGKIRISADVIDRIATVIFRDNGPEYNPLERSNPDAEKRIKEHKIGGFGIFIVKKLMDDVRYERADDTNILMIMKEI